MQLEYTKENGSEDSGSESLMTLNIIVMLFPDDFDTVSYSHI